MNSCNLIYLTNVKKINKPGTVAEISVFHLGKKRRGEGEEPRH